MRVHVLDLITEYSGAADVSVMVRPTDGGRRMLHRAAELGARMLRLPSPRDPRFAELIGGFLAGHPADVFHCHVGTRSEDRDGVRLARLAGCRVVVQTRHLPYLVQPADPAALRAAIAALFPDPRLRHSRGAAGRRRYLAESTRERTAARTADVYERELLAAVVRRG
ncbi:hypothetical protein FHU33_2557 [Blastococcus colisei]|uniref:Glycosyl transferase family 4 n=1 Tax=Blastococcus colisei TaxID=1564162 RepID=A0A543PGB8_9ACTN|nr:hypothetical protein [Blastococcus colisei]TQN43129.1 hypothetical protein FHU33_2557 [Blastococcus colisei]